MTLRRMIWLNPQSHLWFVNKFTLSVIIFAKIIYFVIILLSQTVVRTLSRQPFFYAVRYYFPLFYIFPDNRKTRRTEVLRVSYVWTQRYLAITNLYSDYNYSMIVATRPDPTVRPPSRYFNPVLSHIFYGFLSKIQWKTAELHHLFWFAWFLGTVLAPEASVKKLLFCCLYSSLSALIYSQKAASFSYK